MGDYFTLFLPVRTSVRTARCAAINWMPSGATRSFKKLTGANTYLTSFKYNLAGDLTHITNHGGEVISYGHDDLGNVVAIPLQRSGRRNVSQRFGTGE